MQIELKQLQSQQLIMTSLGFYDGKCEGIWGPVSIEAKRKWEASPSFVPGLPNNGLPLSSLDMTLPKDVTVDARTQLMTHPSVKSDSSPVSDKPLVAVGKQETPVEPVEDPVKPVDSNTKVNKPSINQNNRGSKKHRRP